MIKAYVVGISTLQEGEEIEIRYSIFHDDTKILEVKKSQEYKKPFLVTHFAIISLLKELKKQPSEKTEIIMFDPAVYEQIKETSTTKNKEALRMAKKVREELAKFDYPIEIFDVTGNGQQKLAWDKVLAF